MQYTKVRTEPTASVKINTARKRVWETEKGTTVQNNCETVTKSYVVDYFSIAFRDILVTEEGSWTQRYVYDLRGMRISAEFGYAEGTERGDGGENFASDIAEEGMQNIWYRSSQLGSSIIAVDKNGGVISHAIYDPWGSPLTETYPEANYSGIDGRSSYTGYTWDEVLRLYYAQARFYDPEVKRFTQEDPICDGINWHSYCVNNPINNVDYYGLSIYGESVSSDSGSAMIKFGDYSIHVAKTQEVLLKLDYFLYLGRDSRSHFSYNTLGAVMRFQLHFMKTVFSDLFDSNGLYKGVDMRTRMNLSSLSRAVSMDEDIQYRLIWLRARYFHNNADGSTKPNPLDAVNISGNVVSRRGFTAEVRLMMNMRTDSERFDYLFGADRTSRSGQIFMTPNQASRYMTEVVVNVWTISDGVKVPSTKRLTVHDKIADMVRCIFDEIFYDSERFPLITSETYGYGWRYNTTTEPGKFSEHSHGIAIDINSGDNPYYRNGVLTVGRSYRPGDSPYAITHESSVYRAFTKYGWKWGGDFRAGNEDYMHFKWYNNWAG